MAFAGSPMSVDVVLQDNVALKQVKVEVSKMSASHEHSEDVVAFVKPSIGKWDTLIIKNISGTEYLQTFGLNVPDTITGNWLMKVTALDEDGNINTAESPVSVHNSFIPIILVQSTDPAVSESGIIEMQVGSTLLLTGNIVDQDGLDYIRISILQSQDVIWSELIQPVNNWTYDLSTVELPPFANTGTFKCLLEASDVNGLYHYATATIKVTE